MRALSLGKEICLQSHQNKVVLVLAAYPPHIPAASVPISDIKLHVVEQAFSHRWDFIFGRI